MKLQVPAQMAGVAGPCPQCAATITAPTADAPAADGIPAAPHSHAAQQPPRQQVPQPQQPQQPVTQPVETHQAPGQPAPQQPRPAVDAARAATAATAATAQSPAAASGKRGAGEAPRRYWMRVVFPLVFLGALAITVLVVLQSVGIYEIYDFGKKKPGGGEPATPATPAGEAPAPAQPAAGNPGVPKPGESGGGAQAPVPGKPPGDARQAPVSVDPEGDPVPGEFPEFQPPPPDDPADGSTVPGAATPPKSPGEAAAAPPASAEEKSPPTAGSRAYRTLTSFLEATTLDERLPLMSKSRLSREQLEASCLAGRLGTVKSKRLAEMVPRDSDGMIQYLYFVSFEDKEEPQQRHRIVVQLVERPGVHPPRVHADAFIEHYEKKFGSYGLRPVGGVATFHCIAEVRTSDLAKNIPEAMKKDTVRFAIKTNPHGTAMFDAFLNKNSPLMDRVGPRKEFPYAESRFCILSFRWNTENPDMPYVELNDIVASGWEK